MLCMITDIVKTVWNFMVDNNIVPVVIAIIGWFAVSKLNIKNARESRKELIRITAYEKISDKLSDIVARYRNIKSYVKVMLNDFEATKQKELISFISSNEFVINIELFKEDIEGLNKEMIKYEPIFVDSKEKYIQYKDSFYIKHNEIVDVYNSIYLCLHDDEYLGSAEELLKQWLNLIDVQFKYCDEIKNFVFDLTCKSIYPECKG